MPLTRDGINDRYWLGQFNCLYISQLKRKKLTVARDCEDAKKKKKDEGQEERKHVVIKWKAERQSVGRMGKENTKEMKKNEKR